MRACVGSTKRPVETQRKRPLTDLNANFQRIPSMLAAGDPTAANGPGGAGDCVPEETGGSVDGLRQYDNDNLIEEPFFDGIPDESRGYVDGLGYGDGVTKPPGGASWNNALDKPRRCADVFSQFDRNESHTEEPPSESMEVCASALLQLRYGNNDDWNPAGGDGPRGGGGPHHEDGLNQAARAQHADRPRRRAIRILKGGRPRQLEPPIHEYGPSREKRFEDGHGVEPHFKGVPRPDNPLESGNHDENSPRMDVELCLEEDPIFEDEDWYGDDFWYDGGSEDEADEEDNGDGLRDEESTSDDSEGTMTASPTNFIQVPFNSPELSSSPIMCDVETMHMTSQPIPIGGPEHRGNSYGDEAWGFAGSSGGYRRPLVSSSDEDDDGSDSPEKLASLLSPRAGPSGVGTPRPAAPNSPSFEEKSELLGELLRALLDGRESPEEE